MADQRIWRNAAALTTRDGSPDDMTWAFGFASAISPDIFPADSRRTPVAAAPLPTPEPSAAPSGGQIVFIEGNVPDAQLLAAGVAPGVQVVILDPGQDGVQQIAAYLSSHAIQNLAAIDIVAHGADGLLNLGSAQLDSGTIGQYQAELAAIGAALRPGGDIQLYGCDVAQDAAGHAFLQQLSRATGGANIAASSHLVGSDAEGGNWNLNVDVGTIDVASPFTAAAVSAYPDVLSLTSDQIIFATWSGDVGADADGNRVEQFGVSGASEISGSTIDLGDGSQSSYSGLNYLISGIAVDTAKNEYFAAVDSVESPYALTIQEGSLSGTGGVTKVYTVPLQDATDPNVGSNINFAILGGVAIDPQTNELYYAQAAENTDTGATVAADTGIYEASISASGNLSPTLLTSTSAGLVNPDYIALDPSANLLFFDDSIVAGFGFPATDNLDEVNLSTGSVTVMESFFSSTDSVDLMRGLAINGDTLYLTTDDPSGNTSANNQILSIPFTVSGSGSTAKATVGTAKTLYSGTGADQPADIVINAAQGIFYTTGDQFISTGANAGNYYGAVYEGSLSGGASLTEVLSMSTIITNGDANLDTDPVQLVLLTQPTITPSGTVDAISGGSAVTLDTGITVSDPDGQNLASATITGALTGDTLSYNGGTAKTFGDGFTITSSFSGGTLTLSGNATPADYQSVLDAVTFATTNTTATTRTIGWTASDGVVSSATSDSTVDVHVPPVVTAGGTAAYAEIGPPVALDPGLTVSDQSSGILASATVSIGSGFLNGDTLSFGNQNGITGSYNSGSGVLTLLGAASLAHYDTALESITYSFNGDPTDHGTDPDRTISWLVNDGVLSSAVADSSLTTSVCYCAGTHIAAERGEVPVEALREGDRVVTFGGEVRPIVWIGQRRLDVTRHPDPRMVRPIRVRRGAIAEDVPHRDLLVSPDHAVFLDGLLIPARLLANGMTITQDAGVRSVRYFHVELDRHAVLLAEGLGCESYLDTGNRGFFANARAPTMLHPRLDDPDDQRRRVAESCAPFADDAARVEPVWRRLAERAGALGFHRPLSATSVDPALHIVAGGRAIRAVSHDDDRYVFVVPRLAGDIRLISRSAAPCDTQPWIEDRRRLGVMLRRAVLRRGASAIDVALDDPRLAKGWWGVERGGTSMWRWTDGDARFPAALFEAMRAPFMLELEVGAMASYPLLAAA